MRQKYRCLVHGSGFSVVKKFSLHFGTTGHVYKPAMEEHDKTCIMHEQLRTLVCKPSKNDTKWVHNLRLDRNQIEEV